MAHERFWAKVAFTPTCWLWTASLDAGRGYGRIKASPINYAHVYSYVHLIGPIPEGLQIDHLCRVTRCVNPLHLEAVTREVNDERRRNLRTHCPQGHEYTSDNSLTDWRGYRLCRICRNTLDAAGKRRRRTTTKEN